ncbi:MAG: ATP synthase F1 subunit delta, partial [Endozoicomonas sp.]
MELTTCARPYAKAAFEHARSASSLGEWEQMLLLGASVVHHEKVADMLSNPQLSGRQQADAFIGLCQDSLNREFENFIQVLSEHRRITLLPEIASLYRALKAEEER